MRRVWRTNRQAANSQGSNRKVFVDPLSSQPKCIHKTAGRVILRGCDCSTDLKTLPLQSSSVFGDLILQRRRAARTRSPLVSYILCAFEIR